MTKMTMKIKSIICSLLTLTLLASALLGCATKEQKQAKLQAEAKISKADAEKAVARLKEAGATAELK